MKSHLRCASITLLLFCLPPALAQKTKPHPPAVLITHTGHVDYRRAGEPHWYAASDGQPLFEYERLRTHNDGRAVVELQDLSRVAMNPRSELTVLPPRQGKDKASLHVSRGMLYFLHRNRPGEIDVDTPVVSATIEGTEFVLFVDEDSGATRLTLLDGRVSLTNRFGQLTLKSGEEGLIDPGMPPRKTAVLEARNIVQWFLYYPGILAPDELNLDPAAQIDLRDSLSAYRAGDLLQALALYPSDRTPTTTEENIYLAALKLSCGQLTEFIALDAVLPSDDARTHALRVMVAAVQSDEQMEITEAGTASENLAFSYLRQSRSDLTGALESARKAIQIDANFGLGWARAAELEFSFGRVNEAQAALERALALSPRNAQAFALKGFLELANGRSHEAGISFSEALAIDPTLANAWLGRGLVRIRTGHASEGRSDLQTAVALEPDRSLLRSYLGKAFSHEARFAPGISNRNELRRLAVKELNLAAQIDPLDPTPWLYLALLKHEKYNTCDAINSLEQSQRLNDNRAVYRSKLLLDQDQAVRSANLAQIFGDAYMIDVGVRESARAVSFDYANYSAHLNLANSFNELRDPTRFNLRYESAWFSEHLLASLLAPSLSQNLFQQEYSQLFVQNRYGLSTSMDYLSTGEVLATLSQNGTFGGFSYSFDVEYQHKDGVRINNDLDRLEGYLRLKQRLTPQDSVFLLAKYQDYDAGDNFQYYDAGSARPAFRYSETQAPILLAGLHHEWSPGIHTLILGGRLVNEQELGDTNTLQSIAVVNPVGVLDPSLVPFDANYESQFEIYSAELNQIFQRERHTDILGVRYQDGTIQADNTFDNPPAGLAPLFALPSVSTVDSDYSRLSLYAYHHWELVDDLLLIGGLAYDDMRYPVNFRRPPLEGDKSRTSEVSPKAALLWDIMPELRARAAYAQALGGLSYDESVRLEPTQLAGFSQSYRSLISESLVGSVEAPEYEIIGGAVDVRPWRDAWLSLQSEMLQEEVDQVIGIFNYDAGTTPAATPASTREQLDYHEFNTRVIFNQILAKEWFLEAKYQFTRSELEQALPDIAASTNYVRTVRRDADLHQAALAATWQHPSGFFSRFEFVELIQQLGGSTVQPDGNDLPLLNLYTGYRFPYRRGELILGVMNVFDKDYHFSPLNYHPEYPHERAFYVRVGLNF